MGDTVVSGVRKATVNLSVIGWTACDSDLNEGVAEAVTTYIQGALLAGLDADEIKSDLALRWSARFSEVSVEVTRGLRNSRADVLVFAAPRHAPIRKPTEVAASV